MAVMKGRRLKFTPDGEHHMVAAVAMSSVVDPQHVALGRVVRVRRSTDSKIAGTRLRRSGKGATAWRAEVPREHWDTSALSPKAQLQGNFGGDFRLEAFGERWDRREDAALALAAWHDEQGKG